MVERLLTACFALLLFTAFTTEYRHLVDESTDHLRHGAPADRSGDRTSHRCHNCVTSQPQDEITLWDFHPGPAAAPFSPYCNGLAANPLLLFQLPAERAPPSPARS